MIGVRDAAARIVSLGASLHARRLTHGRTGNLSVRTSDGVLITPTGGSLDALTPDGLALVDPGEGRRLDGPPPSKEAFLHTAVYRARPDCNAVVHLHSTHAVALSCHAGIDPADALPPLTAYYAMRVGRLPVLPFHAPGDVALEPVIEAAARDAHALLLANHGSVAAAADLAAAADVAEEIEETARLWFLLQGHPIRPLNPGQAADLATPARRAGGPR